MPNSSAAMIKEIAKNNGIELESASVDCLLLIYALTFKDSQNILEEKDVETISKSSIKRIREAFKEIHINFGYLQGEGKLKGKKCSDVEQICPVIEQALRHLGALFNIHNQTKPDPQRRPENLRTRHAALLLCDEDLSACRRYVSKINNKIGWWCKEEEEKAKACQNRQSVPPPTPTNIDKVRRSKQKLA